MTPGSPGWSTTTTRAPSPRPRRLSPGRSQAGRTGRMGAGAPHRPGRRRDPRRAPGGRRRRRGCFSGSRAAGCRSIRTSLWRESLRGCHEQRAHLPGLSGEPERAGRPAELRPQRRIGRALGLDPGPGLRALRRVPLESKGLLPELRARRHHDGADHLDREVVAGALAGPRRRPLDRPLPRRDQGARGAGLPLPEHRDRPRVRRRPAHRDPGGLRGDRGPDRPAALRAPQRPQPEPLPHGRQPQPGPGDARPAGGDHAAAFHRGRPQALRRERGLLRGLVPRRVRRLLEPRAGEARAPRGEPRREALLPRRAGREPVIVQRTDSARGSALAPLLRRTWLRRAAAAAGVGALLVGATLWGVYEGMTLYRHREAASLADLFRDVVAARLAIVPNYISGWLFADPERLALDIKHEDFQKLAYQRELAMGRGLRIATEDDYVPARIRRHGERTLKAKVRLKGDWVDHLSGSKWSYRVKLQGDQTLLGMRNFSVQHPKTRRFVYEWVFHQALAREDIIPLRYEFVDLSLNGKDLGIYALEEHFDKQLLEYRQRREGPILKFDESLHWADIAATGEVGDTSPTGVRGFRTAPVDTFGALPPKDDPNYPVVLAAATLLESFRAGELPVAQVFDSKKLATFFALLDLLGAEHGGVWHNLRFYYDPIASRLEPVGFDANAGAPLGALLGSSDLLREDGAGFRALLFADPAFMAEYVANLERVSDPAYLDALLAEIEPGLERNMRILHTEFPWQRFDPEVFRANARMIRNVLAPTKGLHAYLDQTGAGRVDLEIGNLGVLPLEVLRARSGSVVLEPAAATRVEPTPGEDQVAWVTVPFQLPSGGKWTDALAPTLEVEYRVVGSGQVRHEKVFPRPRRNGLPQGDLLRRPSNVGDFAFLEVDEAGRTITIRTGAWTLDRDLIVPPGYRLRAGAGARVDLVRSAMVVSRSPLELRGDAANPVVVQSSDGTGQGLLVLDAGERSSLEHAVFRGLTSPDRPGWKLTGAVTFYRSPVAISHCEFGGNHSEDGINLVRSPFEIEEIFVHDTSSDAFDADFSDGTITRSLFRGMVADGIDVSGARVTVSSVQIEKAGDKGLSAGDHADLTVRDVEVRDSKIGVASKDRSNVVAEGLRVIDGKIGLALYQKKSEFGTS